MAGDFVMPYQVEYVEPYDVKAKNIKPDDDPMDY